MCVCVFVCVYERERGSEQENWNREFLCVWQHVHSLRLVRVLGEDAAAHIAVP